MNAILLTGGKSSRFGRNKALIKFESEVLIERITKTLKEFFDRVYVVGSDKRTYSFLKGVKLIEDVIPDKGPLEGFISDLVILRFNIIF
ncbi:hypothetical protein BBF96_05400 [Anoxybacter fermentans]|uniref:MobA-like NTP transferase domain-containing protein n=1 Tax=Anoxybacter fermentans TaxID=1323375 RepID=A0A3Q9HPX0_9FIRM|nr:NTP transferase domain-containing protein [Anoxybacter fermentans]AZR72873.1 hypothetical protein BBF96_05400 [Anoxybacter fermentans]